MTIRGAIYAEILDDPHADTPRTVLADWLDDHGEPERAEFIRVQVELSQLPDPGCLHCWPGNGCHYHELRRRERELWAAFDPNDTARWLMPPPDGFDFRHLPTDGWETDGRPHVKAAMYRRGFVDEVRLSLAAFVGGVCPCGVRPETGVRLGIPQFAPGCVACHGTGRVPGLARELFAAHPLTKCVLTCREPMEEPVGSNRWAFVWESAALLAANHPSVIPVGLWKLVHNSGNRGPFPTRDDALTALSDALVAYGRAVAGLRPLTPFTAAPGV